jgi:hypothetical protein
MSTARPSSRSIRSARCISSTTCSTKPCACRTTKARCAKTSSSRRPTRWRRTSRIAARSTRISTPRTSSACSAPIRRPSTRRSARPTSASSTSAPVQPKRAIIGTGIQRALTAVELALFLPDTEFNRVMKEGSLGRASTFRPSSARRSIGTPPARGRAHADRVGHADGRRRTLGTGITSFVLACTNGDTFKKGDVINIAAVNEVNLMTRRQGTGATTLRQLSVQADVTGAGGVATVTFTPPLYGPGSPYQNVDALPLAGAVVTPWPGTGSPNGKSGVQSLMLGKGAFALVGVKLKLPPSGGSSSRRSAAIRRRGWRWLHAAVHQRRNENPVPLRLSVRLRGILERHRGGPSGGSVNHGHSCFLSDHELRTVLDGRLSDDGRDLAGRGFHRFRPVQLTRRSSFRGCSRSTARTRSRSPRRPRRRSSRRSTAARWAPRSISTSSTMATRR